MVNNIPVNGWPQLKDLEAVQPILNRLDKIEAWKRTVKEETFTGEEITIDNALALPARSLKTTINAIQDLHGYDKPWAGGAGKNKYPILISADSFSNQSGGTHSGNDGVLTVNVSAVDDGVYSQTTSELNKAFDDMPIGNVTYSFYMKASVAGNVAIGYLGKGNTWINATTSWVRYNITYNKAESGTANFIIYNKVAGARTIEIKDFMIEVGNSMSAYEPYRNECPISGRTAVVLTRSDGDEISEDFTIQLGTTVYGAGINWDTGVMTVTGGAVDLGDLTWSAVNGSRFLSVNEMPNVKIDTSVSAPRNAICSQYVWKKGGDLFNLDDAGFSYYIEGGENRLFVKDLRYSDAASFKAAMSGVTLVYELATPATIQLTPTQLELLKGYNHITLTDGYGTIELKALTGANWS